LAGEKRFLTLDGMRGMAALAVLTIHMGGVPAAVFSGGYLAVDFFFCLSGFVLAHAYERSPLALGAFFRLRLIRLYPLYLIGLGLGLVVALVSGADAARLAGASGLELLFLPVPFALQPVAAHWLDLYPLNPPAWSLFFELVANVAWFAARRVLVGKIAPRALIGCAGLMIVSVVVFGSVSTGAYWQNFVGGFARVAFSFLAGVLTYRLWRTSAASLRVPGWLPVGLLLAVLCAPLPRHLIDPPMVLLVVPPVVFLGACCEPRGALAATVSRALGDASYAVYAIHYPIVLLVDRLVSAPLLAGPFAAHRSFVTTPLTVAIVVLLALWLDRVYDRPVRRWLLGLGARRNSVARPATNPANT
jgi:peptidoglycan/LPS O-acetylase OafA/YrhL